LWSVAAFSLELDDYKEILKAAKKFAMGISESLGGPSKTFLSDTFGGIFGFKGEASIGGMASVSKDLGPLKFSFDGQAKVGQNVVQLGFTDGFKAGVEWYFKNAN
jgi:hypothetical protein